MQNFIIFFKSKSHFYKWSLILGKYLLKCKWSIWPWAIITSRWGLYPRAQEWQPCPCPILDQGARPINLRCPFLACPTQLSVQPGQATTTPTILWRITKVPQELQEHQMHPISRLVYSTGHTSVSESLLRHEAVALQWRQQGS